MSKGMAMQLMLLAANLGLFLGAAKEHGAWGSYQSEIAGFYAIHGEGYPHAGASFPAGGNCKDSGDNLPGVTVYLETTPAEAPPPGARLPKRQWTAVSFKEAGPAPDGSNQAVMSINKMEMKNGEPDFIPARTRRRWQ